VRVRFDQLSIDRLATLTTREPVAFFYVGEDLDFGEQLLSAVMDDDVDGLRNLVACMLSQDTWLDELRNALQGGILSRWAGDPIDPSTVTLALKNVPSDTRLLDLKQALTVNGVLPSRVVIDLALTPDKDAE